MKEINLIDTIKADCKTWERINNENKMLDDYMYLNECNDNRGSGLYQLILNGRELWYGTLTEINAIVKSMIYRLTKEF